MSRPLRIQYPGAFYHVACRGNEKKEIFRDDEDRARGSGENVGRLLDQYPVHCVVFEGIAGHQDEISSMGLGGLDDFPGRGKACLADLGTNTPQMGGFHADLPISGMDEFHNK